MRFKNVAVKNKYLNIENVNIDFNKTGIYILRGFNGSGKTSLIEQLIFDENDIEANTEAQKEAYRKERYKLISYVPQNLETSSCTVYDYLVRENENIDKTQLEDYLRILEIDYINFKEKINHLSGGEVTKLAIISAILKNTPYIIMDEPTNNLDHSSVKRFCELIEKIKDDRTIILITHDSRLQFLDAIRYKLEDGKMILENQSTDSEDRKINTRTPAKIEHKSIRKIGRRLQRNWQNYLNYLLLVIGLFIIILINFNEFENKYSKNKLIDKNIIAIFSTSDMELNEIYRQGAHLQKEENGKRVTYADIPQLVKKDGVKEVYILDENYINRIIKQGKNKKQNSNKIITTSIPNIISNNFQKNIGLANLLSLKQGQEPKDGKRQIALSMNFLKKIGITKENIKLGKEITINGKEYQLCGITENDIVWTSYEQGSQSLYYQYQTDTYDKFLKRNVDDDIEQSEPANVMLITENGKEKMVLNQLFEEYSANNYNSFTYTKVWTKQYNKKALSIPFVLNLILAVIYGIVIYIGNKSTTKDELTRIRDYEVYYLCPNNLRRKYLLSKCSSYLICFVIAIGVNIMINKNYLGCSLIFLGIDIGIIAGGNFVVAVWENGKIK